MRRLILAAFLFLICSALAPLCAADAPQLLFTADGEGHIGPCSSCPLMVGQGGLDRRASLLAGLRQGPDNAQPILIDGGNCFFGEDSLQSGGTVIATAYDALRYDVVNLSYRDFRLGRQKTLDLIKGAKFTSISANLLDDASGKPIAPPFVVKTVSGVRIAVVGLTQRPAAIDVLPSLKQQLDGIRIVDPAKALADILPDARAKSDAIVLVYYGSPTQARALSKQFGRDLRAILVGGIRPDELSPDDSLIAVPQHGTAIAQIDLGAAGAAPTCKLIVVDPSTPRDPAMQKLLSGFTPNTVAVDAQPKPPALVPRGIQGVGLTAEQVNHAIDHGAEFLWNYVKDHDLKGDMSRLGSEQYHILCCQALVHSGAQKKYPDFDAALRQMLAKAHPAELGIYNAGLLNMLIEVYADPQFFPLLQQSSRYLFESQGPAGLFAYNGCVSEFAAVHPDAGKVLEVIGGTPPDGADIAAWHHLLVPKPNYDGDNSVSQFATLGLLTAARSGIRFPRETWQGILDGYRARQTKEGGWAYHEPANPYGSMTCAGICDLAIARFELGEKNVNDDPGIARGVAWLDANFSVDANPNDPNYAYYFLYSLERTGQILQTEFIGTHEWYPLGARHLVDAQKEDGSWTGASTEADPRLATSFALLFLTRATPLLNDASKLHELGTLRTSIVSPPPLRLYIILDCSGSMLDEMDGKQKFQIARDAVANLVAQLPAETTLGLRAYGHRKTALDKDCDLDTELLIPMGTLDQKVFAAKIKPLRARGKTPLTLSLTDAISDIGGSEPTELLLLTDGGEDTMPRKDPVKAAAAVAKTPNIHLDIVGFDVENHDDWKTQLIAMAKAAGGAYWPAVHEADLNQQLIAAVYKKPDGFIVLDQNSKEVAHGAFGDTKTLPPGQYTLQTHFAGADIQEKFWINGGQQTGVNFNATNAVNISK